jgi:hypothetical protein
MDYGYEDGNFLSSAHVVTSLGLVSFASCAVHSWVELKANKPLINLELVKFWYGTILHPAKVKSLK